MLQELQQLKLKLIVFYGLLIEELLIILLKELLLKKIKIWNSLKNVPILSTIDTYELGQICDAVNCCKAKKGEYIIKQSEKGDEFYILDEGEVMLLKFLIQVKKNKMLKIIKKEIILEN